ncbi:MAG: hypothetical protein PVJ39_02395 [Gammaproteobacteria bacterium]|jgi:hypothetical protein
MYIFDPVQNKWIPHRATHQYKKKKKIVRDMWIIMGIFMAATPLSLTIVLALVTTFLSFVVLDESFYHYPVRY